MEGITKVFKVSASIEEHRPEIDFSASKELNGEWVAFDDLPSFQGPLPLIVEDPAALDWDCYACHGAGDVLSSRAVDAIGAEALKYYRLVRATVNGAPYFLPICTSRLDCLNRAKSVVTYFPSNPTKVMMIKKYVFHSSIIDYRLMFSIPESMGRRFSTESVKRSIEGKKLKGFRFDLVWSKSDGD